MIITLRYKLRCFGVPLTGPASILCDNQGVVKNTSIPTYILNKKHYAINYHSVCETVTAVILRVGKEDSLTNFADPFTKNLSLESNDMNFSLILPNPLSIIHL